MDYKPRSPLTQVEALHSLTRGELRRAKEQFGVSLLTDWEKEDKLENCLWSLVWIFERRGNPDFTMDQLDDFSLGDAQYYFTKPPVDGEETAEGKASETTPETRLSGASSQDSPHPCVTP